MGGCSVNSIDHESMHACMRQRKLLHERAGGRGTHLVEDVRLQLVQLLQEGLALGRV